MIRHIALRNWRAYDQLDLALTRPVTFLVAPNGVGKSSLVEAVRWALLGTPADRDRGRAVRGGHDSATVTVELALPSVAGMGGVGSGRGAADVVHRARLEEPTSSGGTQVQVSRTLRRNGTSTFTATIAGEDLSEVGYLELLSQAWSADVGLLDSIIFGPTLTAKATGFPIRDHLASVFGVEPLLRAGREVKMRRDAIAAQIRTLRDDMSGTDAAIAAARSNVTQLEDALAHAEEAQVDSEDLTLELERAARRSLAWQQYRERATDYRHRAQALLAEMAGALAEPAGGWGQNPTTALAASRERATSAIENARAAAAQAELDAARSASAAELLTSAIDVCPTCLRPISAAERDSALAAHDQHGGDARQVAAGFEQQTATARAQLSAIAQFSNALSELHAPAEPEGDDPGPDAIPSAERARATTQELTQTLGGVRERLIAARRHLADLEAAAADRDQLNRLAARDLTLELTQHSLAAATDRLLAERVEPMATEIAHRWKLLFGSEGLRLGADGQLHVGRPDIDLTLADLSGGERATALLISRIILAASATRSSTLWLDEPLEHLDPTRRANVAQTLVRAAQTGTLDQIVVTTYEEGLARRLQATAPDTVQLTYVRSTTGHESP